MKRPGSAGTASPGVVHCIDLRYFDGTVQSVVEDNDVDVVLFMESLGNYTNDTFIENIS